MEAYADVLHLQVRDRVALVTLHRPEVRNALNTALIDALWEVLPAVDDDPGVGAIVLTGSDPAFCSGLDMRELSGSGQNARPRQQRDSVSARGALPPVITPIVGAINGAAVTGGLEVALNCDLLVASERATFAAGRTLLNQATLTSAKAWTSFLTGSGRSSYSAAMKLQRHRRLLFSSALRKVAGY